MKTNLFITTLSAILISGFSTAHAITLDEKTVYAPHTNICVASFGNYIQTDEIIILPDYQKRIALAKDMLQVWFKNALYSGHYLNTFNFEDFYWQLLETKKHVGIILVIPENDIEPDFYTTLGSGLKIPGKKYYGLNSPQEQNGDTYSIVIDKAELEVIHMENWNFTQEYNSFQFKESVKFSKLYLHKSETKNNILQSEKIANTPKAGLKNQSKVTRENQSLITKNYVHTDQYKKSLHEVVIC